MFPRTLYFQWNNCGKIGLMSLTNSDRQKITEICLATGPEQLGDNYEFDPFKIDLEIGLVIWGNANNRNCQSFI